MLKIVKETITKYNMVEKSTPLIIGVSGGPDSMVLLDVLAIILPNKLIVAHLNHKFRGLEADQDANFVRDECIKRGITAVIKEVDVPEIMREVNLGAQETARLVRYDFLLDVAKEWNSDRIVLGHHADDQAETILMRIIRGTGMHGISGIPYIRDFKECKIIRPLLEVKREQIEEYCRKNSINYVVDKSNLSTKYFRNDMRLNVIPYLSKYNKQISTHLTQLGKIAQEESEYLNKIAEKFILDNLSWNGNTSVVEISALQTLDIALQKRIIHLILKQHKSKREISYKHIEDIIKILHSTHPSKSLDLAGLRVYRQYEKIFFTSSYKREIKEFKYEVNIPSDMDLPEIGKKISVFIKDIYEEELGKCEVFDYEKINNKFIIIRSKKDGDKIELNGLQGRKKIKDLYIDLKIPKQVRGETPIIESDDKIIWIPGVKRSKHAYPNISTKKFLYIVLSEL